MMVLARREHDSRRIEFYSIFLDLRFFDWKRLNRSHALDASRVVQPHALDQSKMSPMNLLRSYSRPNLPSF